MTRNFKKTLGIFIVLFALTLSGCSFFNETNQNENDQVKQQIDESTEDDNWLPGMTVSTLEIGTGDGITDTLISAAFDPNLFTIEIQENDPPLSLRDWCMDKNNVAVINGGYFMEDYRPTSLLITDEGKSSRSYTDKNKGMFYVKTNNEIGIMDLVNGAGDVSQYKYALQSFPMLINNSQDVSTSNTNNPAKRSFVGIDVTGNLVLGNTTSASQNLRSFGQFLNNSDLSLAEALNLDGGSSSGFCIREKSKKLIYEDYSLSLIPYVIVVKEK